MIEFETAPGSVDSFAEILDHSLCELNSDYDAKRFKNITLTMPRIISLNPGM